jgi:hypothetical protein
MASLNPSYDNHLAGSLVLDCCVESVISFRDNFQVIFHRIYNDMFFEADIKHRTKALLFLPPQILAVVSFSLRTIRFHQ